MHGQTSWWQEDLEQLRKEQRPAPEVRPELQVPLSDEPLPVAPEEEKEEHACIIEL